MAPRRKFVPFANFASEAQMPGEHNRHSHATNLVKETMPFKDRAERTGLLSKQEVLYSNALHPVKKGTLPSGSTDTPSPGLENSTAPSWSQTVVRGLPNSRMTTASSRTAIMPPVSRINAIPAEAHYAESREASFWGQPDPAQIATMNPRWDEANSEVAGNNRKTKSNSKSDGNGSQSGEAVDHSRPHHPTLTKKKDHNGSERRYQGSDSTPDSSATSVKSARLSGAGAKQSKAPKRFIHEIEPEVFESIRVEMTGSDLTDEVRHRVDRARDNGVGLISIPSLNVPSSVSELQGKIVQIRSEMRKQIAKNKQLRFRLDNWDMMDEKTARFDLNGIDRASQAELTHSAKDKVALELQFGTLRQVVMDIMAENVKLVAVVHFEEAVRGSKVAAEALDRVYEASLADNHKVSRYNNDDDDDDKDNVEEEDLILL